MKFSQIYIEKVKQYFVQYLFLLIFGSALGPFIYFINSLISRNMVDAIYSNHPDEIWKYVYFSLIYMAFSVFYNYVQNYSGKKFAYRVERDMRGEFAEKLYYLPMSFFSRNPAGAMLQRDKNISTALAYYMAIPAAIFNGLAIVVFSLYIVFAVSWKLYLLTALMIPVVFIYRKMTNALEARSRELIVREGEGISFFGESIKGAAVLRSYNLQKKFGDIFNDLTESVVDVQIKKSCIGVSLQLVRRLYSFIIFLLFPFYGTYLFSRGEITTGGIFVAMIQFQLLINAVDNILKISQQKKEALPAIENVEEVYRMTVDEFREGMGKIEAGEAALVDVYFSYPGGKTVLHNLDLFFPSKKLTAVVGASGAGKSTVFQLLSGMYTPDRGKVTMDGEVLSPEALWSNVAVVTQEAFLFPVSIAENIAYACEREPSREEIESAARLVNAHSFIQSLSQGYDTVLREGGSNLSGGQRQLITLARAILKDAPVILFDEPTASQDAELEKEIEEAMLKIAGQKTVIVIAHRLSTVCRADSIYVMENGSAVEHGTHTELMAAGGLYSDFVAKERLQE